MVQVPACNYINISITSSVHLSITCPLITNLVLCSCLQPVHSAIFAHQLITAFLIWSTLSICQLCPNHVISLSTVISFCTKHYQLFNINAHVFKSLDMPLSCLHSCHQCKSAKSAYQSLLIMSSKSVFDHQELIQLNFSNNLSTN